MLQTTPNPPSPAASSEDRPELRQSRAEPWSAEALQAIFADANDMFACLDQNGAYQYANAH